METLYILNEYFPNGFVILVSERISCSVVPDSLCSNDCVVHGISRQEYRSGLPFHTPWYLPHPGTEPRSTCIASGFCTNKPEKPKSSCYLHKFWFSNYWIFLPKTEGIDLSPANYLFDKLTENIGSNPSP